MGRVPAMTGLQRHGHRPCSHTPLIPRRMKPKPARSAFRGVPTAALAILLLAGCGGPVRTVMLDQQDAYNWLRACLAGFLLRRQPSMRATSVVGGSNDFG